MLLAVGQVVTYMTKDKFKQNRKKTFKGHNTAGYACQVNWSPDGKYVMSGMESSLVRITNCGCWVGGSAGTHQLLTKHPLMVNYRADAMYGATYCCSVLPIFNLLQVTHCSTTGCNNPLYRAMCCR